MFALALVDHNGGKGFTVGRWSVVNAAHAAIVTPTSDTAASAAIGKAGRYSVRAEGKTDWGSTFAVTGVLDVSF